MKLALKSINLIECLIETLSYDLLGEIQPALFLVEHEFTKQ